MTTTSPYPTTAGSRRGLPKWAIPVAILLGVLFLIIVPLISSRNRLANLDEDVNQQFAQVEVQQQRRFDLIPNLVASAQGVMAQEREIFSDIANARSRYAGAQSEDAKVEASNQLETSLGRLLVITENYPDLKSNQTVQNLMIQLEGTENRISQERRNYNEVVTNYNRAIRRFPTSIVAGMSGFERRQLFQATAGSEQAPTVNLNPTPAPSAG